MALGNPLQCPFYRPGCLLPALGRCNWLPGRLSLPDLPGDPVAARGKSPPDFSGSPSLTTLACLGKALLRPFVKNATRACMKEKVVHRFRGPGYHLCPSDLPRKLVSFDFCHFEQTNKVPAPPFARKPMRANKVPADPLLVCSLCSHGFTARTRDSSRHSFLLSPLVVAPFAQPTASCRRNALYTVRLVRCTSRAIVATGLLSA